MDITQELKEQFEKFCEKEFPRKIINANKTNEADWFFVQAGTILGADLHYEYYNGMMHLHIEGSNWRQMRDFLRQNINDRMLTDKYWGRNSCQWTLNKKIKNTNDLFDAFKTIRTKIEPKIIKFEREQISKGNTIYAQIKKVSEVLNENLNIPDYQRPYKWNYINVRQLLEDISQSMISGKGLYRIGSVILHENFDDDKLDIVDGQQRITTILLTLICLGEKNNLCNNLKYNHSASFECIKNNKDYISSWINKNLDKNKNAFKDYLLLHCQFVEIIVTNLSEAFQMFDSQNGRGKELEAYNLLKAYHIRAMEQETQETKIMCDKRWESATMYKQSIKEKTSTDLLKQVFSEQLYRTRLWSKKEHAYEFSKKEIQEFKGYTLDKRHNIQFPFQNLQLLQHITSKFYESVLPGAIGTQSRFSFGDAENINPFVNINQSIVNGKNFFEYIETYVEIYKRLFIDLDSFQLKEFKTFYKEYCNYDGSDRIGDKYLKEVFKSIIFITFDRFGEVGVQQFYKTIYAIIYKKRLELGQVKYATIAQYPSAFFLIICNAKNLSELNKLEEYKQLGDIKFTNAQKIHEFFTTNNLIKKEMP